MNALTFLSIGLYSLPMIITLIVGLVLVATTPRSGTRSLALAGLVVLLVGTLASLVQSSLPMLLVERGMAIHAVGTVIAVIGGGVMLIHVVGMVLVVWALRRALRRNPSNG